MSEMPMENANQNPINVQLRETQYSVVPENRVTVPVVVENLGDQDDHFEISLRGIPLDWVDIETPVVHLKVGERREVAIVIESPPASQVRAGQNTVTLGHLKSMGELVYLWSLSSSPLHQEAAQKSQLSCEIKD
jgi:hypothetical protein